MRDDPAASALGIDPAREIALLRARLDLFDRRQGERQLARLRGEQMAALAYLRRPEPIDQLPQGLSEDEECDYLMIARSPLFDARWYLAAYADVADPGADPLLHYLRFGWREGRQPGPAFDGPAYIQANPDVRLADVNPVIHWHRHGIVEQRPLALPRTRTMDAASISIVAELRSFEEFLAFRNEMPLAFSPEAERQILSHVRLHGTHTDFFGRCDASQTVVIGTNLRVDLISGGTTARDRAVGDAILAALRDAGIPEGEARVRGEESAAPVASMAHGRFVRCGGAGESLATGRRSLPIVRHADDRRSRSNEELSDIIFSCDMLQHVADPDAALRDAARHLAPGGTLIAAFPFDHDAVDGRRPGQDAGGRSSRPTEMAIDQARAEDRNGTARLFEMPGWDMVGRALAAGFSDAAMRFVCDQNKGIVASAAENRLDPRGVFMLVCVR